jgi:SAM-dependent methyltransferase
MYLNDFYKTSLGISFLKIEKKFIDDSIDDVFGFFAIQVGAHSHDFLNSNRIKNKFVVDKFSNDIIAESHSLPFESDSIDLLVAPHILDFSIYPQECLREIVRVLKPGGHLVLTLFNYYSLFSFFKLLNSNYYKVLNNKNTLSRIKDWLNLLNVNIVLSKLDFYNLPVENNNLINKFVFLEHVGKRWLPFTGSIIMMHGVKTISSINLIKPSWNKKFKKKEKLSTVR